MTRWTPRQRDMLLAMGLRIWERAPETAAAGRAPATPDAKGSRSARDAAVGPPPTSAGHEPSQDDASTAKPPRPAPTGIATMEWPALRAAVAACEACALCKGRTHTVFGIGNPQAHWMIVGEAPGEQEDLRGEPFVGKSGQLLDNMLRALQLTRDDAPPQRQVFIANTLKCRPPGNRNPEPAELARCEPYLVRQIELVRPRVILAMGRFAVQALLRSSDPIGRLRGRVHRYQGVPLVVTYHPAYLLRNPQDKARAWEDLCIAARVVRDSPPD